MRVSSLALALLALPHVGAGQDQGHAPVLADVPFIAQTTDLCGGAAAAMVLRYWGIGDAQPEDFASLVRQHGIRARDLVAALESRGVVARPINAGPEDARREIASGRPVVALIDGGGGRLHYVVIVAWASERVLFHDPAAGPFQVRSEREFLASWKATGGFALVITPGAVVMTAPPIASSPQRPVSACDPRVDRAIELARGADPELAVPELVEAQRACPEDPRASSALAGVRFRQKRWREAAALARRATERDADDPEPWRLLGASLYLDDEPRRALAAWNRVDEPRLDRVEITGLARTRQDIATAVIGLHPRGLLTSDVLARARRRLDELPTSTSGGVRYRPLAGGRADVVADVGEGGLIEPPLALVLRLGAELLTRREGRLRVNSPTGRGEALEIGGRFDSRRPAAWVSLDTPRLAGLPGVVSLSGLWDRQTYRLGGETGAPATVETRRGGAVNWNHWTTASFRLDLGTGVDLFDDRWRYVSMRGGAEKRLFADRVSIAGDGGRWMGVKGARTFAEFGGAAVYRSAPRPRRVTFLARLDARRATRDAPLALWPAAGTGASRSFLLRGSRLVGDGEVVGEAFGRGLLHGTAEAEIQVADRALVRLGLAAFVDWAKPWDTRSGPGSRPGLLAFGAGLRLHAPGSTIFRIDLAKRPGTAGVVISAGVIPNWPRR